MAEERRRRRQEEEEKPEISRRSFFGYAGAGVVGAAVGVVAGKELFPKTVEVPVEVAAECPKTECPPCETAEAAPAAAEAVEAESPYKSGYRLVFNPYQCSGCMRCAMACSEKWSTYLFPEETKNSYNMEWSRIRPMRFQYVDILNVCQDCHLIEWAEGTADAPCQTVCPQGAIKMYPEGEGEAGYYGMGYKWVDRDACIGLDACGRCAEVCEDQFGSGISFDPIEGKAMLCSRCGGDPECVKHCPEPLALQWLPALENGRYYAYNPVDAAKLQFRKLYGTVKEVK